MVGKKLTKNLAAALVPFFEIPVLCFDANAKRELPAIVVGYDSEELTKPGLTGHYTVNGFVMVAVQGHEDPENEQADTLADEVIDALCSEIEVALNVPDEGDDERPAQDFFCYKLLVRGTERQQEDNSTFVLVKWDAWCRNSD